MPLVWLTNHAGYLPGPVNLGLIRFGDQVVVVDAGLDDGSARRLIRELTPAGLKPAALFLTHHHADHTGGAPRLAREGISAVAASSVEASLIRHPYWEPHGLCGGAHPPDIMRKKFLMPAGIEVTQYVSPGTWRPAMEAESLGAELPALEVIALPGHSPGQVGLLVDGVLFAGDALLPEKTWRKYRLTYFSDMGVALDTCDRLVEMVERIRTVLPAHGSPARNREQLLELVEVNRQGIQGLARTVSSALSEEPAGLTLEQVLERVSASLAITPIDIPEYFLGRATVQAVLTYLSEKGQSAPCLEAAQLRWRAETP
ncbi:MAG: MBL fold metallo-hydrolase [Gaiellales bacterium]|nr:MBL fold metallo-hydrolase [Gaiellales bacterium]